MIKLWCEQRLQNFIKFLSNCWRSNNPDRKDVDLMLLYDVTAVEDDEGNTGFAVYLIHSNQILLPVSIPEEVVEAFKEDGETDVELNFTFYNLAHEYKHYLQFTDYIWEHPTEKYGTIDKSDAELEAEANAFADVVVADFKRWEAEEANPTIATWGFNKQKGRK